MLSKRKLKYLVKSLTTALQAEIDPLVNKVRVYEYQKNPPSLIYLIYLNPQSFSSQQASRSYVFTSYLNPSSKSHPPIYGFFQCFSYTPKLLSIPRIGEVSVWAKNLLRMCKWKGRSRGKL